MASDFLKLPNLISIGRLFLLIPTGYFLAQPEPINRLYALACLIAAGISDFLDGYFARRLNQKTQLGLILDPLSDKIMATALIILLMAYRDFPFWLAASIIGRDLLIATGGLIVKSKLGRILPSNLTGKYCFASIAVLLAGYVIEFDFGIWLMTVITVVLIALSTVIYGRGFIAVIQSRPVPVFADKPAFRFIRVSVVLIISAIYFFRLFQFIGWI